MELVIKERKIQKALENDRPIYGDGDVLAVVVYTFLF